MSLYNTIFQTIESLSSVSRSFVKTQRTTALLLALVASGVAGCDRAIDPPQATDNYHDTPENSLYKENNTRSSFGVQKVRAPLDVERAAREHLADCVASSPESVWAEAELVSLAVPMYHPLIENEIAYYEFTTTRGGFLLVSATELDALVPHWGEQSEPPSVRLERDAKELSTPISKIYVTGPASYAAQDNDEQIIAHVGQLPLRPVVDLDSGGITLTPFDSWGQAKESYSNPNELGQWVRASKRDVTLGSSRSAVGAEFGRDSFEFPSDAVPYVSSICTSSDVGKTKLWVLKEKALESNESSDWSYQPYYYQWDAQDGLWGSKCLTGCGPTAWSMLMTWTDRAGVAGHPTWKGIDLYGGTAKAPLTMSDGVKNMILDIRESLGTSCLVGATGGASFTVPSEMSDLNDYLSENHKSAHAWTYYNPLMSADVAYTNKVRDIVLSGNAAVMGYGQHYALAYGYRTKCVLDANHNVVPSASAIKVNEGWRSTTHGEWLTVNAWFAGKLLPGAP